MTDERYRVHISTPNSIIFLRNRGVRTPVLFENLSKEEFNLVRLQIQRHGLKFSFSKGEKQKSEEGEEIEILKNIEKEVVVEDIFDEDIYTVEEDSILDKLLQESK